MKKRNRIRCVLLGLLCLMPALFFWALKSLPIDPEVESILMYFGGATHFEFIVCGFIFPLLAIGLGWNAYRRCENQSFSKIVVAIGLIEVIGALTATLLGVGF